MRRSAFEMGPPKRFERGVEPFRDNLLKIKIGALKAFTICQRPDSSFAPGSLGAGVREGVLSDGGSAEGAIECYTADPGPSAARTRTTRFERVVR
jgi:hypothetical protein